MARSLAPPSPSGPRGHAVRAPLLPLFVKLAGRDVVVVGGGAMAAVRVRQLGGAGARVKVVAPDVRDDVAALAAEVQRRPFRGGDLDGAWYAVAAATPEVNRDVARAAEARRILVNAVDDPAHASAYAGGVVRRGSVTVAVSTGGEAPALAGLLREALEALLPPDLAAWGETAREERAAWKRDGVPQARARPLLLEALNRRHRGAAPALSAVVTGGPSVPSTFGEGTSRPPAPPRAPGGATGGMGFVSLVGAGPGDPSLLTRRAAERLAAADLVLYDALVDREVLRLAPRARTFLAGKRAGRPSVSQRAIERILVRAARQGRRVVRLKCGDPFVFGRGGEEAQALAAAGVPFEVVPGVSSALAAPALAGIPVTHRGLAAGFTVLSGHAEEAYGRILDGIAPGAQTLVVLMGLGQRARIAERLAARGWPAATPAAILLGASSGAAFAWRGTLAELGTAPLPAAHATLPGTLVVGAVAALSLARGAAVPAGDPRRAGPRIA